MAFILQEMESARNILAISMEVCTGCLAAAVFVEVLEWHSPAHAGQWAVHFGAAVPLCCKLWLLWLLFLWRGLNKMRKEVLERNTTRPGDALPPS